MRCRPSPQSAKQVPPSKSTTRSSSVLRASHTCPGAKRRTKKLIHSQPRSCLVRCRSYPDSSDHKIRLRKRSRFGGATLDILTNLSSSLRDRGIVDGALGLADQNRGLPLLSA